MQGKKIYLGFDADSPFCDYAAWVATQQTAIYNRKVNVIEGSMAESTVQSSMCGAFDVRLDTCTYWWTRGPEVLLCHPLADK